MNCTFGIVDDAGKTVTSIAPGAYQVLVTTPIGFASPDLSGTTDMTACKGSAQFQLTGPGVSISTTLDDGDSDHDQLGATFLKSGTYVAVDNNQPSVARVSFTTLASGTPTAPVVATTAPPVQATQSGPSSAVAPGPLRGALNGTVRSTGLVSLFRKGRAVSSLVAGRYTFVIVDQSTRSGFLLGRVHRAATAITKTGFIGKHTLTVDLKPGQWFFYSGATGKKSYFIVVAA
jgi:hypothetical protein